MSNPHTPPPGLAELQENQTDRDIEEARKRRGRVWTRLLVWLGIAWAVAASVVLIILLFSIRHTQIDGTPNGKKLVTASDRILDCTNLDGACTKANQQRLAGQIQGLVTSTRQAAGDAATCGAQPEVVAVQPLAARADAVFACMTRLQAARAAVKP